MTFFDDIFIPANNIPEPSRFDEKEQVFVWQYDPSHEFFIDVGEEIRFRVVEEHFVDTSPSGPVKKNELGTVSISQSKDESKCPYTIKGSINESGLGLVSWWK
jgi:DNA-directed RNA polymerase III subunit RPC8